jgi:phenylalanyl-tRNA synthetase beta subunit
MAKNGEKINALNGEIYELNETDLVIADESKILALA